MRAKSQPGGLSGDAARIRCSSPRLSEIAWTSTIASPRAGSGSGTSWRAIPPRAAGSACGVHKVHQRPDLISTPVAGTPSASKSPHPDRSDPDRAEPGHCRMPRIFLRCTDLPPVPAARQLGLAADSDRPRLRRQKPAAGRSEFCPLTASDWIYSTLELDLTPQPRAASSPGRTGQPASAGFWMS